MDEIQKTLLKNEIKLQLSKAKITVDNLRQVKKNERDDYINMKLLEVNHACLKWALQNKIISKVDLETNKFFTDNRKFYDYLSSGLASAGAIGAALAYETTLSTVTTGGFLGFFTTTTTVATTTTIMATAAPIALAGAGIYGIMKYKENKQIEKLIEYFENEKSKILSFYLNKIDNIKTIEKKNGIY